MVIANTFTLVPNSRTRKNLITKHHLTPKERGGQKKDPTNILNLKYDEHHHPWHILFGIQTLEETILLLLGIAQQPWREDPLEHLFVAQSIQKQERRKNAWRKLFGEHTLKEVVDRLIRLKKFKCRKGYFHTITRFYEQTFGDTSMKVSPKPKRQERRPHRPCPSQFVVRQGCRI